MPKKKNPESQAEQSERFRKDVGDLVAAGELNPTEAAEAIERLLGGMVKKKPATVEGKSAK